MVLFRRPEFSVFVGDLASEVDDYQLHQAFKKYPSCKGAKVVTDQYGYSRYVFSLDHNGTYKSNCTSNLWVWNFDSLYGLWSTVRLRLSGQSLNCFLFFSNFPIYAKTIVFPIQAKQEQLTNQVMLPHVKSKTTSFSSTIIIHKIFSFLLSGFLL